MSAEKSVLSIQSHVTHGYVGNKAATFPLQLHGFDVDAINTVSLSNHSGYPVIKGHRMDLAEFTNIVDGLRANGFLSDYAYVLTGYINNADVIRHIAATVAEVREQRQQQSERRDVVFFCDPVMGDDGKLYCKEEVVAAYRELLAVADVATPNYFEASTLSSIEVKDLASAIEAANWFHTQGTATVVIKSFTEPGDAAHLRFLVSTQDKASNTTRRYTGLVPYHEGRYTGTGDVFAASLVAFSHSDPIDVAVGKAMGVLQDLIKATIARGGSGGATLNSRELRVTSDPEKLLRPTTAIAVTPLP